MIAKLRKWDRVANNQIDHVLVTPSFWCASNLMTFLMILLAGVGYVLYSEAYRLGEFEFEYGTHCATNTRADGLCTI